jgi:allantoinase
MSGRLDLVLRAPRAITPDGERALELGVRAGRIVTVAAWGAGLAGAADQARVY